MPVAPTRPDYAGACLTNVVPALRDVVGGRRDDAPSWLPEAARGCDQCVLLVLDGVGWAQLQADAAWAPTLAGGAGGPIDSVVPTTTAAALTSLTTGRPPAAHGVVGYRLTLGDAPGSEILNVLRWTTERGDARRRVPPGSFVSVPAFAGDPVPVVTRREFASTGFSAAHLGGARMVGYGAPSSMVVQIAALLAGGEPFVYAYYDGLDRVAHEFGLGEEYRHELRFADRLVGDLLEVLPAGAALVVTSDHGQVEVGTAAKLPAPELLEAAWLLLGEGRFRWLHLRPGALADALDIAAGAHGDEAWVFSRRQLIDEGFLGGALAPEVAARLGDLALVPYAPVAYLDPADTGETRLRGRHGSLTEAEIKAPLLAFAAG